LPSASPISLGQGWRRLCRHSYRLGLGWLLTGWRRRWRGARVGFARLLVPLDPWRFYELGRLADETYGGKNLDISSPKLLPSLLRREGRGDWVAVDLFAQEIESWSNVDPGLALGVEDARELSFPDESFDGCLCVSVVEHVPEDGDERVMAEIWRVLRPGGVLHLTTNIAAAPTQIEIDRRIYGEASVEMEHGRVFFERHYSSQDLATRLLALPWTIEHQEYVRERNPAIHRLFFALAPLSYPFGFLLRFLCPRNFVEIAAPEEVPEGRHGVVLMKLRKPEGGV
jgi:SAM-dependent methyltransferase